METLRVVAKHTLLQETRSKNAADHIDSGTGE